jgi:hypothetical protein
MECGGGREHRQALLLAFNDRLIFRGGKLTLYGFSLSVARVVLLFVTVLRFLVADLVFIGLRRRFLISFVSRCWQPSLAVP